MAKYFRGIEGRQERAPHTVMRDTRPLWLLIGSVILSKNGSIIALICCVASILLLPSFADVFFILGLVIFWVTCFALSVLPFKLPIGTKQLDPNNVPPGSKKPGKADGIFFFGNEFNTKSQLWFNNGDMRTHALIFGSTGSGKTEALLSLAYNALAQGSGFIYVDGKGDNSLFSKVFAMARSVGREDDLLAINFMTGAADIIGPQEKVLSNTLNPFSAGSSSMLSQLVVSMMDSSGNGGNQDGDMWKGRAIAFMEALMRPLVYLRDQGLLLLDAGVIRRYFTLESIENLLYDKKILDGNNNTTIMDNILPFDVRDPLENYLSTLPGYQKSAKGKQSAKAYEQHGYIVMQLTRIFGSLADVYGHIVKTNLAEVDFQDIVLNRRILVVLLPALEKSPDELANLGKLIIASLRAMLAAGLGDKIEGDYKDVIETKPTNANTPFLCILDEYGYYAVKGFAVVPAQARSLGFSVIFAGQDLPAFQKASKEEAASICANTNIKICMKLEDPQETWEFFQKTAGEAYVSVTRGFNLQNSMSGAYQDMMEAQVDRRARVDLLDLKDQGLGEAHFFFKSSIIRGNFFYADPPKVKEIKMNQFVKVAGPSEKAVRALKGLASIRLKSEAFAVSDQDTLGPLFDVINEPSAFKDNQGHAQLIEDFLSGTVKEEVVDFGSQEDNTSIFMSIPVDERIASDFFDMDVSTLDKGLLAKEKLYTIVKKLAIMEGKSENFAKEESMYVIDVIESQTDYAKCSPPPEKNFTALINQFIEEN